MNIDHSITNHIAVVPVRAGSKGIPNKNLKLAGGLPLYLHAVQQGIRTVGQVLVTTDIVEICPDTLPAGCRVVRRPSHLASDDALMADVLKHLIETEGLGKSTIVLLQATSPLREDTDIFAAVTLHAEGRHDMVMSVVRRDSGVLKYGSLVGPNFVALSNPAFCFQNRQLLPPVYGPNGAVYVFSAAQFIEAGGFPSARIAAVEMPKERSLDIDTESDLQRVHEIMVARGAV